MTTKQLKRDLRGLAPSLRRIIHTDMDQLEWRDRRTWLWGCDIMAEMVDRKLTSERRSERRRGVTQ